jgi:hypothetical protein
MLGDAEDAGRGCIDRQLSRARLLRERERKDNIEINAVSADKIAEGNNVTYHKVLSDLSVHLVYKTNATFKCVFDRIRKVRNKICLPCTC